MFEKRKSGSKKRFCPYTVVILQIWEGQAERALFSPIYLPANQKEGGRHVKKKIYSHKSFDTLKLVSYHQGIYFPIYSQIKAIF